MGFVHAAVAITWTAVFADAYYYYSYYYGPDFAGIDSDGNGLIEPQEFLDAFIAHGWSEAEATQTFQTPAGQMESLLVCCREQRRPEASASVVGPSRLATKV